MIPAQPWLPELLARPVAQIGESLGLAFRPRPAPGSLAPCPGCGATRRGTDDRRGPVGLTRDGLGWRCHRCDAHGSSVDLAALLVLGRLPSSREDWAVLRAPQPSVVYASPLRALRAPLRRASRCPHRRSRLRPSAHRQPR
jgi:hypothetical protein